MGVAVENYFYRMQELNVEDITFIEKTFLDSFPEHLREMNRFWISLFDQLFQVRRTLEEKGQLDEHWENILDTAINNAEEELHAKVEADSIMLLDAIRNEDIALFNSDADYVDFSLFLSMQYFRTQKIKHDVLSGLSEKLPTINLEAVWGVLKHIFATNLSYELFVHKDTMRPILLRNQNATELITGDQPVINTFASGTPTKQLVDKLELYYPVSPTLAVLITSQPEFDGRTIVSLSETDVAKYNNHIIQNSHEQLYAFSEQALKEIQTR